jgi:pimeloyl-ACP methyl ester carboxylesterase
MTTNILKKLQNRALMIALLTAPLLVSSCSTFLQPEVAALNGKQIEVAKAGQGTATVVFEAGLGNDLSTWDQIAGKVSKKAKIFTYSRPGYGKSSTTTTARDGATIVEELRTLLSGQGLKPPYILVGHSFGGTYMELFAKLYPNEVSGLVMVESRPKDFLENCEKAKLPMCGITEDQLKGLSKVEIDEYRSFAAISKEISDAGPFGKYPVRVLTALSSSAPRQQLWVSMNGSIAKEASDGKQIIFNGASHALPWERPQEVSNVILEIVSSLKK